MKKFNFHAWYSIGYQVTLGIFSLLFLMPIIGHSQKAKSICGVHTKTKVALTGNETGRYLTDRFGNQFDTSEEIISIPANRKMNCAATGFFNINYIGGFDVDEMETICAVFGYLAGFMENPTGNIVEINVVKEPFNNPNVLATGTSLFDDLSPCNIRQNLVWTKMHTGFISSPENADGLMRINSNFTDWHTLADDDSNPFSEFDLYTVALHEALHIIGFSSRISEDSSPLSGFYSEWDKHLFSDTDEAFVLLNAADPNCCGELAFNSSVFTNMPDDLITDCAGNQVIHFGDNDLAEINASYPDGNSLNNYLSHLCDSEAVMFASLDPGDDSRRELIDPEFKILCELGYTVLNCNSTCIIQANLDEYVTLDNGLTVVYNDLLTNDAYPADGSFEILTGCGDWNNVTIVENTNDIEISNLPPGFTNLCYRITGCNGECSDGSISIFRVGNDPGDCDSSTDELVIDGGLESFDEVSILTNTYFDIPGVLGLGTPDFFSGCNSSVFGLPVFWCENAPNEPNGGICHNTTNPGENFIHVVDPQSNVEGFYLPLCDELEIGCDYVITFMMSSGCTAGVNFAFSDAIPCPADPGPAIGPALYTGTPVICNTMPSYTYEAPDIINVPFDITDIDGDGAPDWEEMTVTFTATAASNIVTVYPDINSGSLLQSLYLDDISVRIDEEDLTIQAQTTTNCLGGNVVVEYTICSGEDDVVLLDLNAELPLINGISFTNLGDFDNMGNASVSIPANGCITLELILDVLITVLPGTQFDIHLSGNVIDGCGDLDHWHQVIVDGSNQPPFASFDKEIDCGDVIFTSTDQDPGTTHEWDFGDPASGINNISTDVIPNHTYGVSGTYLVTHTVTNACGTVTMEMEVEIDLDCTPQTCDCPAGGIPVGNGGVVNIAAANLPANAYTDGCVSINGTLVIDTDYTFDNVEFVMSPGSEIQITGWDHDVRIMNSFLHGCEEMWNGIRLNNDATLDFLGNTIRDAEYAIQPTDQSELRVQNNIFTENFVGIYTAPLGGGQSQFIKRFNNEGIWGNTFECPGTLLAPRLGEISYAGVFLNNTHQLYVGQQFQAANIFSDSYYGIYARNSYDFKFYDNIMSNHPELPGDTRSSTGIRLDNVTLTHIERNTITEVKHGVYANRSAFRARKANTINGWLYGIYSADGFDVRIWENDITGGNDPGGEFNPPAAIRIERHQGLFAVEKDLMIYDNTLNALGYGRGVRLESSNSMNEIFDNNVFILGDANPAFPFGAATGISAVNNQAGQTIIRRNHIYRIPGSGLNKANWGINVTFNTNTHIVDNDINLTDQNASVVGEQDINILVFSCPGINICCNNLDAGKKGIQFASMNNLANVHTTTFGDHDIALYLQQAQISQQLDKGNKWAGTAIMDARHQGPASNLPFNFFRSVAGEPPLGYTNINVSAGTPQQWFGFNGSDASCDIWSGETYCNVGYEQFAPEGPVKVKTTKVDKEAIVPYGGSKLIWQGGHFDACQNLFNRIANSGPYMQELPEDYLTFYNSQSGSSLDKFLEAKKSYLSISKVSADFTENLNMLSNISEDLDVLNELYNSASQSEQPAIAAQMAELTAVFANFINKDYYLEGVHAEYVAGQLSKGLGLLESVNAANNPEKNRQLIDLIVLKKAGNVDYVYTSADMENIKIVAEQCPFEGGAAVYLARDLRSEYDNATYDWENECTVSQQKLATPVESSPNVFNLYPNPSSGELTIGSPDSEDGPTLFELSSLDGKLLKSMYLDDHTTSVDLTTQGAGFYTCKFFRNGKLIETQKLVLIK